MVQADFCPHALQTQACPHALATLAWVCIKDDATVSRPPPGDGSVHQGILPGRGLLVLDDLLEMGLAHLHYGPSLLLRSVELGCASPHASWWQRWLSHRAPPRPVPPGNHDAAPARGGKRPRGVRPPWPTQSARVHGHSGSMQPESGERPLPAADRLDACETGDPA
jgi:hypothetical protein